MAEESVRRDHLRVALVCPYSLSRPGGVQGQVVGLARSLVARGNLVAVFAPVDDVVAMPDGVELVPAGRSTSLRANGSVAPVSLSPRAARRALAELRTFAPDVIHVHEPFAPGLTYAVLIGRNLAPVIGTFHRSGGSPLYSLLAPVARRVARHMVARFAVSEAAASTARTALGGQYVVLFNGIEVDRFVGVDPWPATGPTALFLGRHESRKGLSVLLEAWRQVDGEPPRDASVARPVLWVAGDGPETAELRARWAGTDSIEWLGVVGDDEKIRRLAATDVLVAPALGGESFGLVILEGMAARSVVVASDIDGYRDAAGGCAVLVPPGDAPALARAVADVFAGRSAPSADDGSSRRDWLESGAARASAWSMDALAEQYEERYRDVAVGSRS